METGVNEHDHQEAEDGGKRRIAPDACGLSSQPGCPTITASGPSNVPLEEVSPERVGWKAFGLSALPPEWVPSFFVIESACVDSGIGDTRLQSWIIQCLTEIRVQNSMIFVRSSGAAETMRNRGRLASHVCQPEAIVATIKELSVLLQGQEIGRVHWVIQQDVLQPGEVTF